MAVSAGSVVQGKYKTKQLDAVREVWLGHIVTDGLSSLSIRWGKKFHSSPCIICVPTSLG